jgi:hypothetical protein
MAFYWGKNLIHFTTWLSLPVGVQILRLRDTRVTILTAWLCWRGTTRCAALRVTGSRHGGCLFRTWSYGLGRGE